MDITRRPSFTSVRWCHLLFVAAATVVLPLPSAAQEQTGSLTVTVQDETGAVIPGALVRITSTVLIGGPKSLTTKPDEQLRFLALPPGSYVLESKAGFNL